MLLLMDTGEGGAGVAPAPLQQQQITVISPSSARNPRVAPPQAPQEITEYAVVDGHRGGRGSVAPALLQQQQITVISPLSARNPTVAPAHAWQDSCLRPP